MRSIAICSPGVLPSQTNTGVASTPILAILRALLITHRAMASESLRSTSGASSSSSCTTWMWLSLELPSRTLFGHLCVQSVTSCVSVRSSSVSYPVMSVCFLVISVSIWKNSAKSSTPFPSTSNLAHISFSCCLFEPLMRFFRRKRSISCMSIPPESSASMHLKMLFARSRNRSFSSRVRMWEPPTCCASCEVTLVLFIFLYSDSIMVSSSFPTFLRAMRGTSYSQSMLKMSAGIPTGYTITDIRAHTKRVEPLLSWGQSSL
mmetsp:Transcript_22769/g.53839  ORF Transcript_22769/g.53839 Transcript_22769/m.53839 type:complete len:262 (+) Transcript_22769:580-1365(+)